MQVFASNLQMELQQRGSEYSQLFSKYDHLRPALLERMPPLEVTHRQTAIQEMMTNGEQTPSPSSGDETSMPETDSAQDSVGLFPFVSVSISSRNVILNTLHPH